MDKKTLGYIRLILIFAEGRKKYLHYPQLFDLLGDIGYQIEHEGSPNTEEERGVAKMQMEFRLVQMWRAVKKELPMEILEEIADYKQFCLGFGEEKTFKKLQAFYDNVKDEA